MTRYQLQAPVRHTLEIKKSQFITWLLPLESKQQAKAHLEQARAEYPDARHHCWAYVMGDSPNSLTAAMSDDGEPSGTAGKPMLNVLQHKPVNNVMAIVIRYFGGIKLGAGGLVRAYSQAVEQAFSDAELVPIVLKDEFSVTLPFAEENWLRHILNKLSGEILNTEYQQQVRVILSLPQTNSVELCEALDNRQLEYKIVE
jgi:uncharacterized YigZ family protein